MPFYTRVATRKPDLQQEQQFSWCHFLHEFR